VAKPSIHYGIITGSNSWGLAVNVIKPKTEKTSWILETRFYDCKGENEFNLQGAYGGTYSFNEQSLVLFPIFVGFRKTVFHGKIENNFIPFIESGAGPVFLFDGDETIDRWFKRWSDPSFLLTGGLYLGLGLKFRFPNETNIFIRAGYDIIPLSTKIDDRSDYNGAVVQILFSR